MHAYQTKLTYQQVYKYPEITDVKLIISFNSDFCYELYTWFYSINA